MSWFPELEADRMSFLSAAGAAEGWAGLSYRTGATRHEWSWTGCPEFASASLGPGRPAKPSGFVQSSASATAAGKDDSRWFGAHC